MGEFFFGLGWVTEGLGDLGAEEFAEAFAEAVDGDFEGAFGDAEAAGAFSLGGGRVIAGEPGFKGFEVVGFVFGFEFLFEREQGAAHDFKGPFAIEVAVGRDGVGVGDLERFSFGGVVAGLVQGFGGDATAAFLALGALAMFGEEMFERAEKIGAEAAAGFFRAGESATGENAGEEILGEFAGFVVIAPFFAEEGKDSVVVSFAEIGERGAGFR